MRKVFLFISLLCCLTDFAQTDYMVVEKTDNTTLEISVNDIKRVVFKSEDEPVHFKITTENARALSETNFSLEGSVFATNATKDYTVGFFITKSGTPSADNYVKKEECGTNVNGHFNAFLNLASNTTIYYCAYVCYDGKYYYGETKSVVVKKKEPSFTITTNSATEITSSSAKLSGKVEASNTTGSFTYGFFVSLSGTPTIDNCIGKSEVPVAASGIYVLTGTISKLSEGTLYYYRTYVYYNGQYYYGNTESFRTEGNTNPKFTVTTNAATEITSSSAKLNGHIDVSNTTGSFEYGFFLSTTSSPSSSNYTKRLKGTGSSNGSYRFDGAATGLTAGTTYYFRAYTYYNGSYSYGNILSFKTSGTSAETTYKVGDLYPNSSMPEGVVFYISDGGKHGKIVSLDHSYLYWDTSSFPGTYRGCTNTSDGSYNNMPSSSSRTLAGPWCTNHGAGWYCPARGELVTIAKNVDTINSTLQKVGYSVLESYYWSSTESSAANAYIVTISPLNSVDYAGKYMAVSKDQNYLVCAVKKF